MAAFKHTPAPLTGTDDCAGAPEEPAPGTRGETDTLRQQLARALETLDDDALADWIVYAETVLGVRDQEIKK